MRHSNPVRLGNHTYRAWGNIELLNYFLKPHENRPTTVRNRA